MNACARLEAVLLQRLLGNDQHRRGGVAGLARYTGGDRAAGRERFELGHLFDRRVAAGFVHLQAFGLDDLAIESTFLLCAARAAMTSENHTPELPSLMRTSYAVLCLKKKTTAANENSI